MKILVLGSGNIGKSIAYDLGKDYEVSVGDVDEERLKEIEEYANPVKVDATDKKELKNKMDGFDLIVDSLPGSLGFNSLKTAIKAKKDIVSISFTPEDPLKLQDEAREAGITIIPDAGFAPGLSNLCTGRIFQELDELKEAIIRVGGLPKDPKPPLYYRITWSLEGLIDEYTRKAGIVKNGETTKVDPFEEIRNTKIRDFEFEEFVSDGLRTLMETIDANNMEEWTLRWEGHLDKIKTLRELGFFKEENLKNTLDVISPHMRYDSEDFCIMKVEGKGKINGKEKEIEYYLYDEEKNFTSMARITGFTAAVITRITAEKDFENGVIPPECLDIKTCDEILSELRNRNITIERNEKEL